MYRNSSFAEYFYFKILMKTAHLCAVCVYMRFKFIVDPIARRKDLEEVTKSYNLPEGGLKLVTAQILNRFLKNGKK